jgi:hypothetical protein
MLKYSYISAVIYIHVNAISCFINMYVCDAFWMWVSPWAWGTVIRVTFVNNTLCHFYNKNQLQTMIHIQIISFCYDWTGWVHLLLEAIHISAVIYIHVNASILSYMNMYMCDSFWTCVSPWAWGTVIQVTFVNNTFCHFYNKNQLQTMIHIQKRFFIMIASVEFIYF